MGWLGSALDWLGHTILIILGWAFILLVVAQLVIAALFFLTLWLGG